MPQTEEKKVRPIFEIAQDIRANWAEVNFAAKPYLDAMGLINKITDSYYNDSAKMIVTYFLGNAGSWRGDHAKRIKAELRAML